jgi:hypothetical protein
MQAIKYEESSSSSEEEGGAGNGSKERATIASNFSRFRREREKDQWLEED